MQQLEDLSQIKKTKKKIARIKTLIHEVQSSLILLGVKKMSDIKNKQSLIGKVVSVKNAKYC